MELDALVVVYRHGLHAVPRVHQEYLIFRALLDKQGRESFHRDSELRFHRFYGNI